MEITQDYIEDVRIRGYRPCVIAAFTTQSKVALFRSNKYPGYEFIQGGIEPGETPFDTIKRETREEAGTPFYEACEFSGEINFMFETDMEMKIKEKIRTNYGQFLRPRGKHYFVFHVPLANSLGSFPEIALNDSNQIKFSLCKWCDSNTANKLALGINNQVKREIVLNAVNRLKQASEVS